MKHYITSHSNLNEAQARRLLKGKAHTLTRADDLAPLMERIGDSRIVMLGEASHGTHEFYTWRAAITRKLVLEKGFNFIAVEGDWPDCYRLNRYVKGYPRAGESALEVLRLFRRWPTWMWANWEVVALGEWLNKHNKGLPRNRQAGFYGLDVYSLWESMDAIIQYLEKTDRAAAKIARDAAACFEPYRKEEGQGYARASMFVPELCETDVINLLAEIRRRLPQYNTDHENVFSAEQNALVAVNAERYYRAMIQGGPHSWNIRDEHMGDTLERLLQFHGEGSKAIVWAHNTHIGDARATDMAADGMLNIGEIARLKHHEKGVVLVGFSSYEGSVIAGRSWGADMRSTNVPAAKAGSWEDIVHKSVGGDSLFIMDDLMDENFMENHIGHRAIGVVYNPKYERYGNYVPTVMPLRYDAVIHLNDTRALHPLHILPHGNEVPETYPFGV